MDRRITILKDVIRHPITAFREIDKNGRDYLTGAVFLLLTVPFLSWVFLPEFFTVSEAIAGLVNVMVCIVLTYYIGRFLKGKAEFTGLFSALGYSHLPSVFSSIIFGIGGRLNIGTIRQIIDLSQEQVATEEVAEQVATQMIPLLKELFTPINISLGVIAFLIGIWGVILTILACREAHKFSTKRAVGTFVIAMFVGGMINSLLV